MKWTVSIPQQYHASKYFEISELNYWNEFHLPKWLAIYSFLIFILNGCIDLTRPFLHFWMTNSFTMSFFSSLIWPLKRYFMQITITFFSYNFHQRQKWWINELIVSIFLLLSSQNKRTANEIHLIDPHDKIAPYQVSPKATSFNSSSSAFRSFIWS